ARQFEDRARGPLRHRFEQIGRLAFENLARGFVEHRITHGVADPIAGRRRCDVERYLEVRGEGLAELALGRVVAVIAEGGQTRENELSGGAAGALWRSTRPFCRHALTNIRPRVMIPR